MTAYHFNKRYTGTFTFKPADKTWLYDPKRNPLHNYSAHHQLEVNLVRCRNSVPEIEYTFNDNAKVMKIEGHKLPCYFADGFSKPTTKSLYTLIRFRDDFRLLFTFQYFVGRMTKIEDKYWIETDFFCKLFYYKKLDTCNGFGVAPFPYVHAPQT